MASRRRGHGEGSIYQRADGYWVASVEAGRCKGGHLRKDGTPCPGGERRRARIVRRLKKDVLAELADLTERGREGVAGKNPTVDQYAHWWLINVKQGEIADSSLVVYRDRIDNWIVPYIGSKRMRQLNVELVQQWQRDLAATGIGSTSRADARTTLSSIFKYALGARTVSWNPVVYVTAPKTKSRTDDTLTADEADHVLATAADDRLFALYVLAIKYGLRQGELLRLTWAKVDLDKAVLKVGKAKTEAGVRDLPLLAGTLEALKAHRVAQAAERLEAGPGWNDEDLVFPRPDGTPYIGRRIRDRWNALLKRAGIDHHCSKCGTDDTCSTSIRRFHSSRHTAATLLLEAGVPLEVVSAILGHANIGITSRIYTKIRQDLKRRGLLKLDDAGGG